ncbi:MAG TPA: hypothetical protein PK074_10885 [Spirochaetales bacterium]|nr:hypothetical protein [Spirochaetales bacterium]
MNTENVKAVIKEGDCKRLKFILNIYKNNSVEWFPEIVTYCKNKETNFIQFEWIEGCVIDYKNIKRAFYDLGKFHNKNKVSNKKYGFITLC